MNPTSRLWLPLLSRILLCLYPQNAEALAGDLLESLAKGRSRVWLWRQIAVTLAVGLSARTRRDWPALVYASVGTLLLGYAEQRSREVRRR